jgi:hypothetical protein
VFCAGACFVQGLRLPNMQQESKLELSSDVEASITGKAIEEARNPQDQGSEFPEGGLRAWSVAVGCAGVLFSTFGFVNAFGYVLCSVILN